MREGDKRVVNIKDGEMRGREERKGDRSGRLLSFSLHGGEMKEEWETPIFLPSWGGGGEMKGDGGGGLIKGEEGETPI